MTMIIIAGYSLTDADQRDAAVAAFAEMVARARAHDGCLDFAISADAVDPARVNIFERWRDQQALDAWRSVAKSLNIKLPKVQRRDTSHVKLYRTERAENPF
jgi:quinol monooxygenase YgiN